MGTLLGGILARCQTEVTATAQLSCWVPLQTFSVSVSVCVHVCVHVCVCICLLTSSAFICTPTVKHCGGAWATECSHTHTQGWGCMLSSPAFTLVRCEVLTE